MGRCATGNVLDEVGHQSRGQTVVREIGVTAGDGRWARIQGGQGRMMEADVDGQLELEVGFGGEESAER